MIPEPQLGQLRALARRKDEHGKLARTLLDNAGYPEPTKPEGKPTKPEQIKPQAAKMTPRKPKPEPARKPRKADPKPEPEATKPEPHFAGLVERARAAWQRTCEISRILYHAGAILGWFVLIAWMVLHTHP